MTTLLPPSIDEPVRSGPTFESNDPTNGEVLASYAVHDAEDVAAAVGLARHAAGWWGALSFEARKDALLTWRSVLTRRIPQLAEVVHRETGKPHGDAQLEIVLAIDHLAWAARNAGKVLGRRRVGSGLLMANMASSVEYRPLGVVGVIGPWNYPVFTPMGSIAYALAAGNAVVFKPSEHTPGVGSWLAHSFNEVVGAPVLQVVTGFGETGDALCRSGVDKLAFTGSGATGRRVMAACAERLTPVIIEAGGKDAFLVDEDADLAAAADAALWSGMSNAGQTCIGTERVYVHEKVFEAFLGELTDRARALRPGAGLGASYGPATMASQLSVIREHLDDAVAAGAHVVLGGPDAVGERYVGPTILSHVPEDSTEITEETFGPTLAVNPVRDMDEAIERANATRYGLAGTVFSRARGAELAARIRSGMISVNSVLGFAGVPALPFGGVGESGFGRIHGPDGLKEFTYSHAVTRQRYKPPMALTSFTRDAATDARALTLVTVLHGGKPTMRARNPRRRRRT